MYESRRAVLAALSSLGFGRIALAQGLSIDLGLDSTRTLNWVLGGADLDFDFTSSRFYQSGQAAGDSSLITVSRASVGYSDDTLGNWTSFGNNVGRITDKGLLVEEARTNSIRNNSMQGAVAGSPGTLPTNWSSSANPTSGISSAVIGTGTESGIDYIELQISGTASASAAYLVNFETINQIAAAYGQTWSGSIFVKLQSGTLTGISSIQSQVVGTNGASGVENGTATIVPTTAALGTQKVVNTYTLANSTVTNARQRLAINFTNTSVLLANLRIGWPQLENNSINSTVASAAIAAGGTTGAAGTAVYQVGGGTGTPATLNVTVSGGAITTINSVASAGNYTVFPPSPAALTYVSGAGSGVVGATVNLTPTDNSAQGFVTSPIRTTAAAATRATDVPTVANPLTFGSAYTIYGEGIPIRADTGGSSGVLLSVNNGSATDRLQLARPGGSAQYRGVVTAGGSNLWVPTVGTWSQNISGKLILAFASADHAFDATGQSVQTDATAGTPAAFTTIGIGQEASASPFNGYVKRIAIWPATRLSNAMLQSLTQ